MKKELAQIVYKMYCHLDYQYDDLIRQGNGRIVHDVNSSRTAINGTVKKRMKEALKSYKGEEPVGKYLATYLGRATGGRETSEFKQMIAKEEHKTTETYKKRSKRMTRNLQKARQMMKEQNITYIEALKIACKDA